MAIWIPGVDRDENIYGLGGGSFAGGPAKIVLHTTEGGWDSALSVFRSRMTAPHMMAAPPSHPDGPRRVQFVSLDRSAYALRNDAGGVETNRDHALQVEIVWWAARARELTAEDLDWLGTQVVAPLVEHAGEPIRLEAPTFYGPDPGWTLATETARQRMGPTAWDTFNGVCGHQHVPENEHWDPGAIDIARILAAAGGTDHQPTIQEDDMILQLEGEPALFIGGLPHLIPGPLVDNYAKGRQTGVIELPANKVGREHYARLAKLVKENN